MIKIDYNKLKKRIEIRFTGQYFSEYIRILKKNYFKFNNIEKFWTSTPQKAYNFIEILQDRYEDPIIDLDTLEYIKNNRFEEEETVFERNIFRNDLLKYKPIKGKSPNENYQVFCTKKGINQNRLALYLDPGAGKSKITIDILNHYFYLGKLEKVLILCPYEGVWNWVQELNKFFYQDLDKKDIYVVNTINRKPFETNCKFIICTYRNFVMISDDYYKMKNKRVSKKYRRPSLDIESWGNTRCIICDESHSYKNTKSRNWKIIELYKDFFKFRYNLSGTATPNNFSEIYAQMKFLDRSLVPNDYHEFLEEIANMGVKFGRNGISFSYVESFKEDKIREYEKRFKNHIIKFKIDEILDLPEIYEKNIYVELPIIQKQIYRLLVESIFDGVKKGNNNRLVPMEVYKKFPYMVLALDNPAILRDNERVKNFHELYSLIKKFNFSDHGKLEMTEYLVDKYIKEGRKVIIFDYHPKTLDSLHEYFKKYNPYLIHGESSESKDKKKERNEIINDFRKNKKRNLLIGSFLVLGTSINLQEATRAIYFSRNYSFEKWTQSQKRLHRIGSKEKVIINPLIFENTIDVRRDEILKEKSSLDDSIFRKDYLNKKEWANVLRGKL